MRDRPDTDTTDREQKEENLATTELPVTKQAWDECVHVGWRRRQASLARAEADYYKEIARIYDEFAGVLVFAGRTTSGSAASETSASPGVQAVREQA